MKKGTTMVDGTLVGLRLDIEDQELSTTQKVLQRAGAQHNGSEWQLVVTLKSSVVLSLRQHYHNKDEWYLNMSGNPLTFCTGDNSRGYVEADRVIVTAFRRALQIVEEQAGRKLPPRLFTQLVNRQININYIEFATYTTKILDVEQYLNDVRHMYSSSYSSPDGLSHNSVTDLLGLKLDRQKLSHTSVCLKIMAGQSQETEAMLMAYDKEKEAPDLDQQLKGRVRLELSLQQGWFRRRQIEGRKLKTLADLCLYVEAHGNWQQFVASEIQNYLDRTMLFKMWTAEEHHVPGLASAFRTRRQLMHVTDRQWQAFVDGKTGIGPSTIRQQLYRHIKLKG